MAQVQQYQQPPAGLAMPPQQNSGAPDPWLSQFINENWQAILAGGPDPGPDYQAITAEPPDPSTVHGPPAPEQKPLYGYDWWRNSPAKRDLAAIKDALDPNKAKPVISVRELGQRMWDALPDAEDFDAGRLMTSRERKMMGTDANADVAAAPTTPGGVTPASGPNYNGPWPGDRQPARRSPGVRPAAKAPQGGAGLASRGTGTQRTAGSTPAAMTPQPPQTAPQSKPATAPQPDLYAQALAAINGQGQKFAPTEKDEGFWNVDTRMALLQAGLATMAAADRPGASALGSIGQGGMAGLAGYGARKKAAKDERRQQRQEEFQRGQVLAQLANAQATAAATAQYRAAQEQHQRDVLAERSRGNNMNYQARMFAASKPPASAHPKAPPTREEFVLEYMKDNPGMPATEAHKAYDETMAAPLPPPPPNAYMGDEPPEGIDGAQRSPNGAWYVIVDGDKLPVMLQ